MLKIRPSILRCAAVLALAASLQQVAASPTITTDVAEFNTHAQAITVTVKGVHNPKNYDAVGLLVPHNANRKVISPQKIQWLVKGSTGKGYLTTGSSTLTFKVLAREPFRFILARHPGTYPSITTVGNSVDWLRYTILASSAVINLTPFAKLQPTQLHLVATNISSRVGIQWTTAASYPAGVIPKVYYGVKGAALTQFATATSDTYTAADMCGIIANSSGFIYPGAAPLSGQFYTAYMDNLKPYTEYEYYVGAAAPKGRRLLAADPDDCQENYGYGIGSLVHDSVTDVPSGRVLLSSGKPKAASGVSPSFSSKNTFLSPPTNEGTVKFLLFADQGYLEVDGSYEWDNDYPNPVTYTSPDKLITDPGIVTIQFDNVLYSNWITYGAGFNVTTAMLADIKANPGYSLAMHNGDISYAQGFTYGWDQYWENLEPLYTQIPHATSIGNHERDWPGTVDRAVLATSTDSGGECGVIYDKRMGLGMPIIKGREYYSFDHGPIHFLQFNTEINFDKGSAQWNFMAKDLAAVDRSATPWLVVGHHRPYYAPTGQDSDTTELQPAFDDLFMKYQVDFTTYGHVHTYARTCPVYKRICQPNDADGSTTAPVHLLTGHAGASVDAQLTLNPAPAYYEAIAVTHGYARVHASKTYFAVEVVDAITGNFLDSVTYTKPYGWRTNMTRQLATIANYVNGSYVPVPYEDSGTPDYGTIVGDVEGYIFNKAEILQMLVSNALVQKPEAPDWMGSMNPFWQTLDQIFGAHFNSTTKETDSYYTTFYHPLWTTYKNNPNGVFLGPFVNKSVPALPPGSVYKAYASPIPDLTGLK